mmetsp:Transcript_108636/g.242567  ORF Transcript_108636/g.242567 Transcript_108636/m.242567 type:complete len:379 (+) Transcript_108636:54-1190(+)
MRKEPGSGGAEAASVQVSEVHIVCPRVPPWIRAVRSRARCALGGALGLEAHVLAREAKAPWAALRRHTLAHRAVKAARALAAGDVLPVVPPRPGCCDILRLRPVRPLRPRRKETLVPRGEAHDCASILLMNRIIRSWRRSLLAFFHKGQRHDVLGRFRLEGRHRLFWQTPLHLFATRSRAGHRLLLREGGQGLVGAGIRCLHLRWGEATLAFHASEGEVPGAPQNRSSGADSRRKFTWRPVRPGSRHLCGDDHVCSLEAATSAERGLRRPLLPARVGVSARVWASVPFVLFEPFNGAPEVLELRLELAQVRPGGLLVEAIGTRPGSLRPGLLNLRAGLTNFTSEARVHRQLLHRCLCDVMARPRNFCGRPIIGSRRTS